MLTHRFLEKKVAKVTYDPSAYRTIDSAYTFDAADINETADTITITGHPYKTGDLVSPVLTATTGVTATVPAMSTAYYIIVVDKNTVQLATSLAYAKAGTYTALTAGSAADVYLQRKCFGDIYTGLVIPKGAIVTNIFQDVITTFVSYDGAWGAGNLDKATVALTLLSAGDVLAAIAIEDGTNMLDAGRHTSLIGYPNLGADAAHDTQVEVAALFAASTLKMTSDAELLISVAVDPASIGKMDIYVEYYI